MVGLFLASVAAAAGCAAALLMPDGEELSEEARIEAAMRAFHEALSSGASCEIGNFFSFASAYQYWRDVTAALGVACPPEDAFRRELVERLGRAEARKAARSSRPALLRVRIIGAVAAAVFRVESPPGEAVASVVLEGGAWKVRTWPGVFPGELFSQARL